MKVDVHIPGQELHCLFRGCEFDLQRDGEDDISPGCWYMIVTDGGGFTLCDGWITDSEDWNEIEAMNEACRGALIEPPKRWPASVRKAMKGAA